MAQYRMDNKKKKGKHSGAYNAKVDYVMGEFGRGALRTSAGKKVTDAAQAAAIAHSEARRHVGR